MSDEQPVSMLSIPLIAPVFDEPALLDEPYARLAASISIHRQMLEFARTLAEIDTPARRIRRALEACEYELTEEQIKALGPVLLSRQAELFREMVGQANPKIVEMHEDETVEVREDKRTFGAVVSFSLEADMAKFDAAPAELIEPHCPAGVDAKVIGAALRRAMSRVPETGEGVRVATLIAAVGSLETFLQQAAAELVKAFPSNLRDLDFSMSSRELLDRKSIRSIHEEIEKRWLERLNRKGFAAYNSFFEQCVGEGIADLREVVERRNLLVHHDGHVTEQYLQTVEGAAGRIEIGDRIGAPHAYCGSALRRIETTARSIATTARNAVELAGDPRHED